MRKQYVCHKWISQREKGKPRTRRISRRVSSDLRALRVAMAKADRSDSYRVKKIKRRERVIFKYSSMTTTMTTALTHHWTIIIMSRDRVVRFGPENIKFNTSSVADEPGREYMAEASRVFTSSVEKMCVSQCVPNANDVTVFITTTSPFAGLKLSTNESYSLNITTDDCTRIVFNLNNFNNNNNNNNAI